MKIITKKVKSRFRQCLYPYEEYHSKGFHYCQNRRLISLLIDSKNHTTISYAKYLWETSHRSKVKKGYEIDHIDGDCTNDILKNLQVLSKKENNLKGTSKVLSYNSKNKRRILLWCPVCNKRFKISKWKVNLKKLKKGKEFHFCCKECLVKAQHLKYNFEKQKYKRIKQKPFNFKNQCEDFRKFSKPIYIEKKIRVCDCGNAISKNAFRCKKCDIIFRRKNLKQRYCICGKQIINNKAKYCCKNCRIRYGDTSNCFKVDKEKLIKYCKISLKKFKRYNYSWIGIKLGVSSNAIKNNINTVLKNKIKK